jgi:hypothetical protein
MANQLKNKGFKRFFLGLGIYAVVFLALVAAGLAVFWNFIEAYELSRPKNAIAPYVEQLTKEYIAKQDTALIGQIDHNIQSKETIKSYIADSLQEDITYAQNVAESTDTQLVYMLLHSGKAIGKVTLQKQEADSFGFTPWKVTDDSFDFSYLLGSEASITVPHDFTVYVGDTALDSSYISQDNIPYDTLKSYYKDYKPPYMVTYTVSPILGDIQFTTKDSKGTPVTLSDDTDLNVYMDNCTQQEKKAIEDLMTPFLHSYVAYTSSAGGNWNARNNYNNLAVYLAPGSIMQDRMYSALDGLSWGRDTGSAITDIQIHHTVNMGDRRYLCDVTYTVLAVVYRDDPITINNAQVILTETEQGLLVESLLVY